MEPTTPPTPSDLQPPSVLLMGGTGSGKTYSLSTLMESGLDLFVIVTEPTGLDSLLNAVKDKKLDIEKLHWKAITPARAGFDNLTAMAKNVARMDFEGLAKLKPTPGRDKAKFIDLLSTLADFKCDRTGKSFGPVDSFGPTNALAVDSLSGLNLMAMDLVIGDKVSAHQGEWGVAMNMLDKLLLSLTSGLKCTFCMTAHLEREVNEVTGGQQIMASTLGRKLAPKIPRFFSEVAMAYRDNTSYYWSTTAVNTDLKNRSLPFSPKLEPNFKPVVQGYLDRVKLSQSGKP
jgi:AAA domain